MKRGCRAAWEAGDYERSNGKKSRVTDYVHRALYFTFCTKNKKSFKKVAGSIPEGSQHAAKEFKLKIGLL